jgi:hypothetical protein
MLRGALERVYWNVITTRLSRCRRAFLPAVCWRRAELNRPDKSLVAADDCVTSRRTVPNRNRDFVAWPEAFVMRRGVQVLAIVRLGARSLPGPMPTSEWRWSSWRLFFVKRVRPDAQAENA